MNKPVHVHHVSIAAPAATVWDAIVDGDATVRYFYGTRVESTWEPGAAVAYRYPDGRLAAQGRNGFAVILSGLKALLETGQPLAVAGPDGST